FLFFQAEDGIRAFHVTGVQTCALPISSPPGLPGSDGVRRGAASHGFFPQTYAVNATGSVPQHAACATAGGRPPLSRLPGRETGGGLAWIITSRWRWNSWRNPITNWRARWPRTGTRPCTRAG